MLALEQERTSFDMANPLSEGVSLPHMCEALREAGGYLRIMEDTDVNKKCVERISIHVILRIFRVIILR